MTRGVCSCATQPCVRSPLSAPAHPLVASQHTTIQVKTGENSISVTFNVSVIVLYQAVMRLIDLIEKWSDPQLTDLEISFGKIFISFTISSMEI